MRNMSASPPRRIDAGDVLAALGALLLLVSLFLAWFGDLNGWQAFETLDLVLAALAILALAAAAAGAGLLSGPSPRLLAPLGALLLVIVAVQLVEPPPAISDDADVETGAWLALAGAALVAIGGLMRVAQVSVSVSVGGRDVRRRVPAVDRRTSGASDPAEASTRAGAREEAVRFGSASVDDPQPTQPFGTVDDR
jgi:hypothetical protein